MAHSRLVIATLAILGLMLALLPLAVTGDTTTTLSIDSPPEVAPGGEFIALVAVDHVQDFNSCNFDLTYNAEVITVTAVTGGEIGGRSVTVGSGDWTYMPPGSDDTGRIRVISTVPGVPGPGVTGSGYVAEVHFRVLGAAGSSSTMTMQGVAMYDYLAAAIATTTVDGSVTVVGPPADLQITIASPLPNAVVGQAYSATLTTTGGKTPYSWTATGLPQGLTCSTAGVISGTPTQSGDFTVTVTVTDNAAASQSKDLALTVEEVVADLAITTTELPDGETGHAYSATLTATGGKTPYSWTATGLPQGLTCSTAGVISGTPAQSGDFTVTVTVTDSAAASQSKDLALKVHPAPQILTTELPGGTVGDAYTITLAATGGKAPYSWTAAGLPPGLACSADGVISGTPVGAVGDFTVTVSMTTTPGNTLSKSLDVNIACKPGDANMDGVVDTKDKDRVRDIIFGITAPTGCADVNGDGEIDVGDITAIRRIYYDVGGDA